MNYKTFVAPLSVLPLIFIMERVLPLFSWYRDPAYVLLYIAFGVNAWFNGSRWSTVATAIMISAYMYFSIPEQTSRWIIFGSITLFIGFVHTSIKERYQRQAATKAAEAERLRQERNRETERVRERNLIIGEIKMLGDEIAVIINHQIEARVAIEQIVPSLDGANEARARNALYHMNTAQTLVGGYKGLAKNIETIREASRQPGTIVNSKREVS